MQIRWYGQSAFLISGAQSVFIDPFGSAVAGLAERGLRFDYPPIQSVEPELLLVTHEHADHNGVEVVGGSPHVLRSTAGTLESPLGEVVAIASEHDDVAGNAGRTRSSASRSTGCGSAASATSGRPSCAASRRPRSARSTSSFCPWATGRRSAASARRQSSASSGPGSSSRCTTAPPPSASSSPRTPSSSRWCPCRRRPPPDTFSLPRRGREERTPHAAAARCRGVAAGGRRAGGSRSTRPPPGLRPAPCGHRAQGAGRPPP
jgi:hypothetical protein